LLALLNVYHAQFLEYVIHAKKHMNCMAGLAENAQSSSFGILQSVKIAHQIAYNAMMLQPALSAKSDFT